MTKINYATAVKLGIHEILIFFDTVLFFERLLAEAFGKNQVKTDRKPTKVALVHQEIIPTHKSCGCNAALHNINFELVGHCT